MDKNKLDKLVDETINSMDAADRAMPAPFLLTRINARMDRENTAGTWEKVSAFLAKPLVAFPALTLVLALNFWIIQSYVQDHTVSNAADYSRVSADDYSLSTATSLFDIENPQR